MSTLNSIEKTTPEEIGIPLAGIYDSKGIEVIFTDLLIAIYRDKKIPDETTSKLYAKGDCVETYYELSNKKISDSLTRFSVGFLSIEIDVEKFLVFGKEEPSLYITKLGGFGLEECVLDGFAAYIELITRKPAPYFDLWALIDSIEAKKELASKE